MSYHLYIVAAASCMITGVGAKVEWPSCNLKFDLAVLQDTTGSYFDALRHLKAELPKALEALIDDMPGSRVSINEFRDKPFLLLGDADSFCFRPSTRGFVTDNFVVSGAYAQLWGTGGGDLPEAQLHSLVRMAHDQETINWCRYVGLQNSYKEDECSGKIIVIITDAVPHDPDDYTLYNGADPAFAPVNGSPIPPMYMPPFPDTGYDTITSEQWDKMCDTHEYPSLDQFVRSMKATNIDVIGLITPQSEKVRRKWLKINNALGQPEHMMQFVDANSTASILNGVEIALTKYSQGFCKTLTTTEEPTTEETTTTTTTTTQETTTTTTTTTQETTTTPETTPTEVATTTIKTTASTQVTTDTPEKTMTSTETTEVTTGEETTSPSSSTTRPERTPTETRSVEEDTGDASDTDTTSIVASDDTPIDGTTNGTSDTSIDPLTTEDCIEHTSTHKDCVWPTKTTRPDCHWPTKSTRAECVWRENKKMKADRKAYWKFFHGN